jgi:hypothetical protein
MKGINVGATAHWWGSDPVEEEEDTKAEDDFMTVIINLFPECQNRNQMHHIED